MFAIVRTGGKQYRVAAGDKIVVEKLAGEAGDTISLDDVLLAGEGGDLKSTDGLIVSAEIIAQAKADKVTVFKKKRRHNYRRKRGHRQQLTILKILSIGGKKAETKKAAPATEKAPDREGARRREAEKPAKPPPSPPPRAAPRRLPKPRPRRRRRPPRPRRRPNAKPAPAKKSTKKPAAGKAE